MKSNLYHQQQHNKTFEEDLSFQEWIEYFSTEPTTQELNDMEKVFSKSHVLKPHCLNTSLGRYCKTSVFLSL